MRTPRHRVVIGFALLTAAGAAEAPAQMLNLMDSPDRVLVAPRFSPEFGTSSTSILTVTAQSFQIDGGSTEGPTDGNAMRTCSSASCTFLGQVSLPSGAVITGLEAEGCDGDTIGHFVFALQRFPSPAQVGTVISPVGDSGDVATPGCALFPVTMDHTVDNLTGHYLILVNLNFGGSGGNLGFTAARIRYHLQVSAPPGAATFNDVPTDHPQFQFVEALVAAGITAGCGSGNYCPNAALTRGQMAVFLAKALGLHFPN